MTETCSSMSFLTLYDPMHETTSQPLQIVGEAASSNFIHQPQGICVGKAAPHVELKICADGPGHIGRILTRGPHMMLRYWDEILTNPSNPRSEAWFDTGDIGSMDNHGNLWLLGRSNGRIKSGGENIYPGEVLESIIKLVCLYHKENKLKPNEYAALLLSFILKKGHISSVTLERSIST